ncbi:hypothetical protein [Mangrovicoccus sp. HB161399]|uniref:hypothetical protein n=1 Tax=Mangrovicoccus sp. HB161399 TaxID=2720392 RepID=UPI00155668D8|nr:hypothetical protein [Mangrovicoccus sp. HB161399]
MSRIRVMETLDRRALAGLRLVDRTTGLRIEAPLRITHPALKIGRNRSGDAVVLDIVPRTAAERALAAHPAAFEAPPAAPPAGSLSFELLIEDPSGRYLPRRFALRLPRRPPSPADADPLPADHLMRPVEIVMMPAPAAPVGPNWSGLRASLSRQAADPADRPLAGALLRVLRRADGAELGQGIADRRGEAFVPIVGIPVIDFSSDEDPEAVGLTSVPVRLEILTEPAGPAWPPDPDAILADPQGWGPVSGTLPEPSLRTGRMSTENLSLVLAPLP